MEAGGIPLERARVPAAEIVADSVEAQRPRTSAASLELVVDLPADLPELWCDRHRLLQVLENLIGNAVKFTSPGGRITVGAQREPDDVRFWVRDTGAGIASEDLPRVFDRFWQANRADRSGVGLGLPIVKGLVEAHGGQVWVDSDPGAGSTFSFTIPIAAAEAQWPLEPGLHPA
jgi:signal transduction histidine kinase